MDPSVICVLVLLSLPAVSSKYIHITERKTWLEAQTYCRTQYTDLAPISCEYDKELLQSINGGSCGNFHGWIGLWTPPGTGRWFWSGGTEAFTTFWADSQPNNPTTETSGALMGCKWHDVRPSDQLHFFCFNVVPETQQRTWEEALDYCREQHKDLASVASQTEMKLIQTKLLKSAMVGRVWIGLRFLATEWLWVDGQPLDYQAWAGGRQEQCPRDQKRCAALQVTDSLARAGEGVWIPYNCTEKLPFICY